MHKILIVDDEENIRALIKKYANYEGFQTCEAQNGIEAVELCKKEDFDLIIMDVMMPELNGFSAAREIRKTKNTPIIMLSARGEEYDRIHGFEEGADDYVVKPFSGKELMLRIHAIINRTKGSALKISDREIQSFDGLVVDFTARVVEIDGRRVEMTPKEYDLLFYFVKNKGIALTRERLICEVWGYDFYGDDRTLDTHIKILRKDLGPYADKIVTLRGVGYRFEG